MNKKVFVSIVALGAIIAGSANAAITREQCERSDKTFWVPNVTNSDGSKGACVPRNTCASKSFRNKFCITKFRNIQVKSVTDARTIIKIYAETQLNWPGGCIEMPEVDANNLLGQDYIGCASQRGDYVVFEFDDTNETFPTTYEPDFRKALCMAVGGKHLTEDKCDNEGRCYTIMGDRCNNITQEQCLTIRGVYEQNPDPTKRTCYMGNVEKYTF